MYKQDLGYDSILDYGRDYDYSAAFDSELPDSRDSIYSGIVNIPFQIWSDLESNSFENRAGRYLRYSLRTTMYIFSNEVG